MNVPNEARDAFGRRDWGAAYDTLKSSGELDGDDCDMLAESAHWLGRIADIAPSYSDAYRRHLDAGQGRKASLSAFNLAVQLRCQGEGAQADAWLSRATRLLEGEDEGAEHGYPLYLESAQLMSTDLEAAIASAKSMQRIGARFGDDTLVALGIFFEGRSLVKQARVVEGLKLLDEAMLAALSDRLKPMWTGAIYCGLISACHELADHRRASEWTTATQRWCAPLPAASLYPGICRVHNAELLSIHGAWDMAEAEALSACTDMVGIDVYVVADGFYEVGEIRRLRGDFAGADEAYARAHEAGRDPNPGISLLLLAQGRIDAATSSITAAIAGAGANPLERAPLLAAQVEIALGAGDVELAGAAASTLGETATTFGSEGLAAVAHRCEGAVALAKGQSVAALGALRLSLTAWNELDAPYESARVRVLLARVYDALGDAEAATRERKVAHETFQRLGADPNLLGTDAPRIRPAGLTERELEVLGLVAIGKTNQEIADALFLSPKTVARHVSNIFTKIGVTSRSAATAYAYKHRLVGAPA